MSINTLYPTIKPSLMLDFANTKRLDPRVTFTRTTTATYYDGKTTTKAEENLLLRSQDYSATWTVTSLTSVTGKTAPDGTSTATEFTAGASNAVLTQGYTAVAGSYTFSVWLRRVTGSGNIEIAADNGTWTVKTITGTWARYDVTQTVAAGSKTAGVRVTTNTDAIEVWGAQLEQRASVTAYTLTTTQPITTYVPTLLTAAAGVPRLQHNPVTGESLGLLVESARTNRLLRSEDLNTTWSATRATLDLNSVVSPAGTLTADRLIASTDNDTHFASQTFTGTAAAHTFSVYAKTSGLNYIALRLFDGSSQVGLAYYDLSTGSLGTVTAGTAAMQSVGNGWYRCSLTATLTTSAACTADIQLANADNTNSFAGNAFDGVTLWGMQDEAGAFLTSYIPTAAATVTRNADDATMTGTNFSGWFNAAEGTLFGEYQAAAGTNQRLATISDGSTNNFIQNIHTVSGGTGVTSQVRKDNILQADGPASITPISGQLYKLAVAYKVNDFAFYRDGGTVSTDTSGVLPFVDRFAIGNAAGQNQYLDGTIRKIVYYPIRCTNIQLPAITT